MANPTSSSAPDPASDDLRELLARCIDAVTGGEGWSAVDRILGSHPAAAAEVRERLDKLIATGLVEPAGGVDLADGGMPDRLGDFRLLERIGSGGMGVVFRAEQQSLGREVALKLVRPEQMYFPGARERFRREVEAIARLSHPGIVPIYTVGTEGGIPYFAMELVAGATLADVIRDARAAPDAGTTGRELAGFVAARIGAAAPDPLPETFGGNRVRTACRIIARAARALEHAHQRGVLHRDLKPSNVMLTPTGRVLLLDFGLAALEGASPLTRTGGFVGTLHYTPPEQLSGAPLAPNADVYALGATLYELLTLRPPFDAASEAGLRDAIVRGTPTPLRRLVPSIPGDVETICRVALDADPRRRYATAAALADDLEAFLDHRPITARPPSVVGRLGRAVRRRPKAAAAVAVAIVASVVAIGFGIDAASSRSAARRNLEQALTAIARLLEQARDPALASLPGLDDVRTRQTDEAIRLLDQLRDTGTESDELRRLLASGRMQAAQLLWLLGRDAEAEAARAATEALLDRLRDRYGGDPVIASLDCDSKLLHGLLLRDRGDLDGALDAWSTGAARAAAHLERHPQAATPQIRTAIGACRSNALMARLSAGETLTVEDFDAELAELAAIVRDCGRPLPLEEARLRASRAQILSREGRHDRAQQDLRHALALLDPLDAADPDIARTLARARFALGRSLAASGDTESAAPLLEAGAAEFTRLATRFPDRAGYLWDRGMVAFDRAGIAARQGDADAVHARLAEAIASHRELVTRFPDRIEASAELSTFLARAASSPGPGDDAGALLTEALERLETAAPRLHRDGRGHWFDQLVLAHLQLAHHQLTAEMPSQARDHLVAAETLARRAAAPATTLREALRLQLYAHAACDDPSAAIAAFGRYVDLGVAAPDLVRHRDAARILGDVHLDDDPAARAHLARLTSR